MTKQDTFADKLKTKVRGLIANFLHKRYGYPGRKLTIIGVTGTKGKTITTSMIYHVFNQAGLPSGCITTIGAKIGDQEIDTGLHVTSPEPWQLPRYLRDMVKAGVRYVVLEATSIGLQQGRLEGVEFDAVAITNIESDHLDYHGTWENYAESKFRLVEMLKQGGLVAVNADHVSHEWIKMRSEFFAKEVFAAWYSKQEVSDFHESLDGMEFTYDGVKFQLNFFGAHLLENVLATIKVCSKFLELEDIATTLQSFRLPPGRMETVQKEPVRVIVDFAHTPDSLERSLQALHEVKGIDSRIITVFGCAGDRDPARRMMSIPASKFSQLVILTAEDPRKEDLALINSDIYRYAEPLRGVMLDRFADHNEYARVKMDNLMSKIERVISNQDVPFIAFDEMSVNSRIDAIDFALKSARPGDIVFVTGKGHEQSLCFIDTEFKWSDVEAINMLLRALNRK